MAASILLTLAASTTPFKLAEARVFDFLSTMDPPTLLPGGSDIVIVAIDEPSFAELGLQWPWPRGLHARLIGALRKAGAKAIGVDIVFAEPSQPKEDAALAASLGPDVVLAADISLIETPQMSQAVRTEPLAALMETGAAAGLASITLDADGVLRQIPEWPDGFAARLLEHTGTSPAAVEASRGRFIQALGPARTYPTVSYYQALEPETFLPPGTFEGRTVLIGRSLQMTVSADADAADSYATSFTVRSGRLVPGIEVHATIIDNIRRGLAVRPASPLAAAAAILAAAVLAGLAAWRPASGRSLVLGIGLVVGIAALSYLALKGIHLFLPPLAPSLAVIAVLAPVGLADVAAERRLRRDIVRAFSHYLAPALVERLASEPGALKLGGEKRVLTILFSDVRNFTPLAESMKDDPEGLTQLVNRLLTPLSDAVLDRGGTIDKFIGDCIMAFWNAPLDDPDHARHAVEAGLAMLSAVEALNVELAAEGPGRPKLAIGVGINTGTCVVGNMGSARRFDYSVLGDAVNYAARLESASKDCGVALLLGAATAEAIKPQFSPIFVDTIAVKGRAGTAPVYTIADAGDRHGG